jgi:hypothetical protein
MTLLLNPHPLSQLGEWEWHRPYKVGLPKECVTKVRVQLKVRPISILLPNGLDLFEN